ncbi:MAG TPA: glycosyltransferase family 2 protein [Bacteroidia bacterium]|nr:glycosyltransferase family 2 protein [Sphingobacteriales bacterium]HPD64714.1 glycosyltransferase family 2 protein [Bacteroidia bacterium]HRS59488.1 glycosyltransferase family 2 protein [Bacteroidia bacterium]HRU67752.1 glycosyltransferase family 2 protein [Bacteroidia bacterium]
MQKNIDFSVIVPVFNSQQTLVELFSRTAETFGRLNVSFEVIFVEDGGSDQSWEVIQQLKNQFTEQIIAVKLSKNYGQHNAIFCGMGFASGNFIITLDDDLQIPPEEIEKLILAYNEKESDLVYGFFKRKKHSFIRNIASRFVKKGAKKVLDAPGEGSSFKMIKAELVKKILTHPQEFVFIDELLLWYTDDVAFCEVRHEKRQSGKSGYSKLKLFRLFTNLVIYYTTVPLKMMTIVGFLTSFFAFGFAIYRIYRKMNFNVPLGYTSIIVTILISTGILLFSMGILGEYLNRIYKVQNRKPPFSIRKILK